MQKTMLIVKKKHGKYPWFFIIDRRGDMGGTPLAPCIDGTERYHLTSEYRELRPRDSPGRGCPGQGPLLPHQSLNLL